jgi:hypothetical protein
MEADKLQFTSGQTILAAKIRGDIFDKILETASRGRSAVGERQKLSAIAHTRSSV